MVPLSQSQDMLKVLEQHIRGAEIKPLYLRTKVMGFENVEISDKPLNRRLIGGLEIWLHKSSMAEFLHCYVTSAL